MATTNQVIKVSDVIKYGLDDSLYQLCQSESSKVERYIAIIDGYIFSYIDRDQFEIGEEEWEYPEDLKIFAVRFLENMYIFQIQGGNSVAWGILTEKTEKFDDYSGTEKRDYSRANALSFFGVPIDKELMDILDRYAEPMDTFGNWNIGLR